MPDPIVDAWLSALEARHLADLRVPEVTRALRALSSAYVERRHALARGAALDSAGKRAAFALFYAPIHFLIVRHVIEALGQGTPQTVVDLGCGTGAAGAAWALACSGKPHVLAIDRHPWAIEEARWTFRQLHLDAQARQGDASRVRMPKGDIAIVAAYLLNELSDADRSRLLATMLEAAKRGARMLIVEPIARGVAPWWHGAATAVKDAKGRSDEWHVALERPPLVAKFDAAAGLNHRSVKVRSLFIGRSR